jgi:glutathione S-transferase
MRHHQITFDEKKILLDTETTTQELSQYSSGIKVPVLQDGNLEIWDSLAILEYVSEQYCESSGWPSDPSARAIARSVSAEMHSSFANLRSELPMNCRKQFNHINLSIEAAKEVTRVKEIWRMCREQFSDNGQWLFGEYSIADAMFAPIALRFKGYSIPLGGAEKDYVQSVLNQPCIAEWIAAAKAEKEIIELEEM